MHEAKFDVLSDRERSPEELSATDLEAVSGGWSFSFGPFKITGGDLVDAGKWIYNHL